MRNGVALRQWNNRSIRFRIPSETASECPRQKWHRMLPNIGRLHKSREVRRRNGDCKNVSQEPLADVRTRKMGRGVAMPPPSRSEWKREKILTNYLRWVNLIIEMRLIRIARLEVIGQVWRWTDSAPVKWRQIWFLIEKSYLCRFSINPIISHFRLMYVRVPRPCHSRRSFSCIHWHFSRIFIWLYRFTVPLRIFQRIFRHNL